MLERLLRPVLALLACAAALHAAPAAAQQATVNFLGSAPAPVFEPVIKAFMAANPNIVVKYQQVPFEDLNAAIESRIGQGDSSIDVFQADSPRIPAFASRGYLQDLSAMRARIEAAVPSRNEIEQMSFGGKIYASPMWTSTQLLFFNRDLLAKAGIPEPSASPTQRLTWEEVAAMGAKAKAAGAKWGLFFQQPDRYYQIQPLFESAGAGPGLTGEGLLTPRLTEPKFVATAQWYGELFKSGVAPRGVTANQANDLFANGEVAFFNAAPFALNRLEQAAGLRYGVVPAPYFKGGRAVTPTGGFGLAISARAANAQAAMRFVEFATLTAEGASETVRVSPFIPVQRGALEGYMKRMDALKPKIGPIAEIMTHEMAETAVVRPRSVGYVAFEAAMQRALSDIRNGSDAATVLKETEDQLKATFARIR
jgi:multiple sugar transport system substrate-binding protein